MVWRIGINTTVDRNEALSRAQDAISACEGWVVTHQLFSNIAASLIFEIPVAEAEHFLDQLKSKGFEPLEEADSRTGSRAGDLRGALALTFLHNDPDLKRDVPAFG